MGIALRAHLVGIEPEIWRGMVLPDETALDALHLVLQGALRF